MSEAMKIVAPSAEAPVARYNTISYAPGPTIFVLMPSSWKKRVCDGSTPVGPEGNTKSTLEICTVLASVSMRMYSIWWSCAHPPPDPATAFVHKSTVRVLSIWISSLKVKLRLDNDKLVVGL